MERYTFTSWYLDRSTVMFSVMPGNLASKAALSESCWFFSSLFGARRVSIPNPSVDQEWMLFSQHSPAMPNGNGAALLQRSLVDLVQRAVLDPDVVVEAELGVEGGDGRHGRGRQEAGNQASGNHVAFF